MDFLKYGFHLNKPLKRTTMKKTLYVIGCLAALNVVLISAGELAAKKWDIPAEYASKKNPVKSSADGLDDAKTIWNKECKVCHGATGAGDGVKAKNLAASCGNLTTSEFHSNLSDGGIFYLSFIKTNPDHTFDKKIPDETDRWNLVNYIRTLKK